MAKRSSDKKSANGLVALGSAAVLAVYSAGFYRTKAAAARLEALESRVRPSISTSAPIAGESLPAPTQSATAPETAAEAKTAVPEPAVRPEPKTPAAVPTPLPSTPAATEAAEKPPVDVPSPSPAQPAADTPSAEPPHEAKVEAVAALPAPTPAPPAPQAPAVPTWKDGTWSGWGSARHGSIQASVVVAGGRITAAKIEQCQMRYSCSLLDRLVPQVADRGNPEKIDWVSGATESSNVFYWAVTDALSKAK